MAEWHISFTDPLPPTVIDPAQAPPTPAPSTARAPQAPLIDPRKTHIENYINALPQTHQAMVDQSLVDLDSFTKDPEFAKLSRADRETKVAHYLAENAPALGPVIGYTTMEGVPPGTVGKDWEFDLAHRQAMLDMVLGPSTFQQTTGRTLYQIGRMGTFGAGAIVGGALGGGNPLSEAAGGTLAEQTAEPLLRQMTDLPAPTWGEKGIEAATG